MAIIKEYTCPSCGVVENDFPECPRCHLTEPSIKRVFLTPPGFKSGNTKHTDRKIGQLCMDYGLTDYSNNQSTEHKKDYSDTFKPLNTDLSQFGINLRKPSEEEKKQPTKLRPWEPGNSLRKTMGGITRYDDVRDLEKAGKR